MRDVRIRHGAPNRRRFAWDRRNPLALAIAGMVVTAFVAGACTPAAQTSTEPSTDAPVASAPAAASESAAPSAVTGDVEIWYQDPAVWDCVIDGAVADFNAANPEIHVEGVTKGTEAREAVQVALAGGAGPDVITPFGPSQLAELVEAGHLVALDPYVDQYGWNESIPPWALELGKVDGKLYALPTEVETLVLWYNKRLFDEHGWQPPTTVDEWTALAQQAQAADVIPLAGGIGEGAGIGEWFFGEFTSHVAGPEKVYQALAGEIPWTDPAIAESIALFRDYVQNGYWMGSEERYFTTTFDEFSTAFATGEAAMNLEGTWFYGRIPEYFGDDRADDWDWVPVPSTSGDPIFSLGIGSIRGINAASDNPDAAAAWLNYEFTPQTQATMLVDCGLAMGPVNGVEESMLTGLDPRLARLYAEFAAAQAANNYGYTVWTFYTPDSETYIYEELQKVITGDTTVEDYLAGLDEIFAADLAAGKRPPLPAR